MKMSVKLTIEEAREIRAYRKAGQSIANLANTYQVSTTTIWEIVRGTRFRDVAPEPPPVSTGAPIYHADASMRERIDAAPEEPLVDGIYGKDDEEKLAQILKKERKNITGV